MASEFHVAALENAAEELKKTDYAVALKRNLGDASIYDELIGDLNELTARLPIVIQGAHKLDNETVSNLTSLLTDIKRTLEVYSHQTPEQFVPNRASYLEQTRRYLDQFTKDFVPFLVLAQEDLVRSSLGQSGSADVEAARNYLKTSADSILSDVRREAEQILEQAKSQANDIQITARDTATGVSLLNAQDRFSDLLKQFKVGMIVFGAMSGIGFLIFVGYVWNLFDKVPELSNPSSAIFYTTIRVTMLASLAAFIAFSLKLFRSNLHMYYHTLHRQHLTNTIQTFVEAARTDEQRDVILLKLIEAVASFGNSGLIGNGDDMPNTAKIIVDALPKVLGSKSSG